MKTLGLIGGMSWESTTSYYQWINQGIKERLGGLHSAKLVLASVDFAEIEQLQHQGDWVKLGELLAAEGVRLQRAGAEGILICTNTMHKVAEQVSVAARLPLIHIADATAHRIISSNFKTVGLLGTAFTMEQDFYKGRLKQQGINVLVPDQGDRQLIHDVIYQELCLGNIQQYRAEQYLKIINKLHDQGAEAVILGCTEIGLLLQQSMTEIPLLDTTRIHVEAAVEWALSKP